VRWRAYSGFKGGTQGKAGKAANPDSFRPDARI
jgi:hypothetical protein